MKRTLVTLDLATFPPCFHDFLRDAPIYDSSCSPEAKVYYMDKQEGFFLKTAPANSLRLEVDLTRFFHERGLAPQVIDYVQVDQDWLLTRRASGEDCTHAMYTEDPKRLSETIAQLLRSLHESDVSGCPVPNHTENYCATVRNNYLTGNYSKTDLTEDWGFHSPEEAWKIVEEVAPCLQSDTLLHGDYCLPNIMLDNWKFSSFIDLDHGGIGDRHIDLFWGTWSLAFNLRTDAYGDRFLDAYGRDRINPDILKAITAFEAFG